MSNLFKISIYIFDLFYLINISVAVRPETDNDDDFFPGIEHFKERQIKSLTNAEKEYILDKAKRTNYDRSNFTHLISGGYRPTDDKLTKYIVSIRTSITPQYFGDNHFCAGSIIKPWAILTAAHCCLSEIGYLRPWEMIVVTGTPFRLRRTEHTRIHRVRRIIIHPGYFNNQLKNDIAILILKKPYIQQNEFAQVVPLTNSPPIPFEKCTVIGWGRIYNHGPLANQIIYVDVKIWDNSMCRKVTSIFRRGMLCAGSFVDPERDACTGDSGGPMFCNGSLTGIVSFGWGCGSVGLPGFYTDVWNYHEWIAENNSYRLTVPSHIPLISFIISYNFRIFINIVTKIK